MTWTRALCGLVLAGLLTAASPAWASLMVDGDVDADGYTIILEDSTGENLEDYYNSGLDIDALYFDDASDGGTDWYWLGVGVTNEPIDVDGDPDPFFPETWFGIRFSATQGGATAHSLLVRMGMVGGMETVTTVELDGSVLTAGTDYDAAVDDALEIRIKQSVMNNMPDDPYFRAQLDGSGNWGDDQMTGQIPEPATLSLMGLGLVGAALARRRRRL